MGITVPEEPDPSRGISLTYQEFSDAIDRLRKVDFPIERDPADAWPEFVGWRVNYEQAAYAIAASDAASPSASASVSSAARVSISGDIGILRGGDPAASPLAALPGDRRAASPAHTHSCNSAIPRTA